jgi:uncharacterized small protein (DUF1192 family)
MTDDDLLPKGNARPQDLDIFSIEELEDRVIRLKEEIIRCEAKIKAKKASLDVANALFGRK